MQILNVSCQKTAVVLLAPERGKELGLEGGGEGLGEEGRKRNQTGAKKLKRNTSIQLFSFKRPQNKKFVFSCLIQKGVGGRFCFFFKGRGREREKKKDLGGLEPN